MAGGENPDPKVKVDTHMRDQYEGMRRAWIKKLQYDFGGNYADFYNNDRVRIDYYKKNPPTFPDPSDGKYEHPCRLIAAGELSLDICEMLNHLHISPTTAHVQQTFDNNQIATLRHMLRCVMTGYAIVNYT